MISKATSVVASRLFVLSSYRLNRAIWACSGVSFPQSAHRFALEHPGVALATSLAHLRGVQALPMHGRV